MALRINVTHNGHGFGAYYTHYAQRKAAFACTRDEFERKLDRFLRLCRRFGINVTVVRHPSFYCGLAAELGDELAARLIRQARDHRGPWADWDIWADDAAQEYERRFAATGGWPTVKEGI